MKASVAGYARASDLRHALELLAQAGGAGRVLAGGQSLVAALNMRLTAGDVLVDISALGACRGVEDAGDALRIGALTRHAEIAEDPLVRAHAPVLAEAVGLIAHAAIRNRGTIGGAVAHADPAAEFPACALALGATFEIESLSGTRTMPATAFFRDTFETALEAGEILTAIIVPKQARGDAQVIEEVARRRGDYALAGLCLARRGGRHSVALFSLGPRPALAEGAMRALDAGDMAGAAAALKAEIDPPSDTQASAACRRHLAGVLLRRAAARMEGGAT